MEDMLATARAQLDEATWQAAWAEGLAMPLDQAIAYALEPPLEQVLPASRSPSALSSSPTYPAGLTDREVDVLRLVAQGLSDAQVAEQLVVSPRTVHSHLSSIYGKLGAKSRTAATRFAIDHNLV
jgi:DNA-binding NarL/FixJ family response regulator